MPSLVYESAGVNLRVEYSVAPDNIPVFESIRVLDGDYRPCGPELLPLLANLLYLHTPLEAESFLSVLSGEIHDANVSN